MRGVAAVAGLVLLGGPLLVSPLPGVAVGGLAGALLANQTEYLTPEFMHWTRSGEIMFMVILGGMGTLLGPVIGAVVLLLLEDVLPPVSVPPRKLPWVIVTASAASGTLRQTLALYGAIEPDAEQVRQVSARFPGLIRSVSGAVGARVQAGDALAVIESNESLQSYTVTAPLAGTITARNANPGESSGDRPLFVISNFARVWADLGVFPRDRAQLAVGQRVRVRATDGSVEAEGRIALLGTPDTANRLIARVVVDNAAGRWTPGQFVSGEVAVAETPVAVAVPLAALQKFRDWDVVFRVEGDAYQAMPLELGRRDGSQVEVLGGLTVGQRYVSHNSYLIKADIPPAVRHCASVA